MILRGEETRGDERRREETPLLSSPLLSEPPRPLRLASVSARTMRVAVGGRDRSRVTGTLANALGTWLCFLGACGRPQLPQGRFERYENMPCLMPASCFCMRGLHRSSHSSGQSAQAGTLIAVIPFKRMIELERESPEVCARLIQVLAQVRPARRDGVSSTVGGQQSLTVLWLRRTVLAVLLTVPEGFPPAPNPSLRAQSAPVWHCMANPG